MGSLARVPAAQDQLWAKDPHYWGQKEMNLTVCPRGLHHSARQSKQTCPRGDGTGGTRPGGVGVPGEPWDTHGSWPHRCGPHSQSRRHSATA